ncbi:hypothetical protein TUM17379_19800 [Shewanella algae]|uniref:Uncharacterized protein n=1 Tax=Shewanella algae TaxID=38313 RepID=A0AAD1KDA5_9GAMM|nr:hypothetical protein TUM17379_19800 [Shewanella algae]
MSILKRAIKQPWLTGLNLVKVVFWAQLKVVIPQSLVFMKEKMPPKENVVLSVLMNVTRGRLNTAIVQVQHFQKSKD